VDENGTPAVPLQKVAYCELNGKQQEMYNFHRVAGILADYGFSSIKLSDDWAGADFLASHKDGTDIRRVQLKSRLTIDRKYMGKSLYMAFKTNLNWYLVPHDFLVEQAGNCTNWLNTSSWVDSGCYHSANPGVALLQSIGAYRL
jgi:hypothetical protein